MFLYFPSQKPSYCLIKLSCSLLSWFSKTFWSHSRKGKTNLSWEFPDALKSTHYTCLSGTSLLANSHFTLKQVAIGSWQFRWEHSIWKEVVFFSSVQQQTFLNDQLYIDLCLAFQLHTLKSLSSSSSFLFFYFILAMGYSLAISKIISFNRVLNKLSITRFNHKKLIVFLWPYTIMFNSKLRITKLTESIQMKTDTLLKKKKKEAKEDDIYVRTQEQEGIE